MPLNGLGSLWAKKILLVEDDDDLREFFADTLRVSGLSVQQAPDGLTALHILENDAPDLIVLDLGLPDVDGLSIRDELLAHTDTRDIPVVVVTASAETFGHRLRDDCVLRKPVTAIELVDTVRRCLNARRRQQ